MSCSRSAPKLPRFFQKETFGASYEGPTHKQTPRRGGDTRRSCVHFTSISGVAHVSFAAKTFTELDKDVQPQGEQISMQITSIDGWMCRARQHRRRRRYRTKQYGAMPITNHSIDCCRGLPTMATAQRPLSGLWRIVKPHYMVLARACAHTPLPHTTPARTPPHDHTRTCTNYVRMYYN